MAAKRVALLSSSSSCLLYNGARRDLGIKVPTIAESISTGKIKEWKKKVGDSALEDEHVCQIESDKAEVEVRAPCDGTITEILAQEGETVNVGQEIASMNPGKVDKKTPTPASPAEPKAAVPASPVAPKTPEQPKTPQAPAPSQPAAPVGIVSGTDPRTRRVRTPMMRQRIADRLKASQNTAAILTTFNEIDMSQLIALRDKYKDDFHKKHGVKFGFMSAFAKASAAALQDIPIVNASWEDEFIAYHDYVDISVAVATPTGLVVPVLRDVQDMTFADIEKKIAEFGDKAKNKTLSIAEMTGGTFTISNGGVFGSWMGTPIINPPQSAILGMHATKKKPWVDEKTGAIVVRPIMAVALSYDHRLIDGRDAVSFLVKVKNVIEDPQRLVLDLA